jgi:hypothetical protein
MYNVPYTWMTYWENITTKKVFTMKMDLSGAVVFRYVKSKLMGAIQELFDMFFYNQQRIINIEFMAENHLNVNVFIGLIQCIWIQSMACWSLEWRYRWIWSVTTILPFEMYPQNVIEGMSTKIVDVTLRKPNQEESINSWSLGRIMMSCDKNLLPLVKYRRGCYEYFHVCGKIRDRLNQQVKLLGKTDVNTYEFPK